MGGGRGAGGPHLSLARAGPAPSLFPPPQKKNTRNPFAMLFPHNRHTPYPPPPTHPPRRVFARARAQRDKFINKASILIPPHTGPPILSATQSGSLFEREREGERERERERDHGDRGGGGGERAAAAMHRLRCAPSPPLPHAVRFVFFVSLLFTPCFCREWGPDPARPVCSGGDRGAAFSTPPPTPAPSPRIAGCAGSVPLSRIFFNHPCKTTCFPSHAVDRNQGRRGERKKVVKSEKGERRKKDLLPPLFSKTISTPRAAPRRLPHAVSVTQPGASCGWVGAGERGGEPPSAPIGRRRVWGWGRPPTPAPRPRRSHPPTPCLTETRKVLSLGCDDWRTPPTGRVSRILDRGR